MTTETRESVLKGIFNLLKITFVILPIAAGADKFLHLLTDWNQYMNPDLAALLPFSVSTFMLIAGVIEIIAGIIVLVKPHVGGFIVAAWLTAIALTLIAGGMYLDIAVRDIVMAISAFSMARLARVVEEKTISNRQ